MKSVLFRPAPWGGSDVLLGFRTTGLSTHQLGSGARQEEGPDDLQIGSYVFEVTLTSPLTTTPSW